MENKIKNILKGPIRFLNHADTQTIFSQKNHALTSFAIDDSIATTVGNHTSAPTFRMWVHEKTVVFGIPDSRVPYFTDGLNMLQQNGYETVIRNSGGLAVTLDSGVLNMSVILPNDDGLSIHEGYDFMVGFIKLLLKEYTNDIEAYEIVGSYCPGDYDLSINGIKFAGISQRRVRDGVAVQIYLDIEGSSKQRAALIRDFYTIGIKNETTKHVYPEVNPEVMGSLNELLHTDFTVDDFIQKISLYLQEYNVDGISTNLTEEESGIFTKRYEQMLKRNRIISGM